MTPVRMLPLLLLAIACSPREPYTGNFDLPSGIGILQPQSGGPFSEPIGYVANGHGGQIPILALKQGRYLVDDRSVSFLRGRQLATGGARLLQGVAPYAPDDQSITVYATDKAFQQLAQVPHILDTDGLGAPIEGEATVGDVTFTDADGSGGAEPRLVDLEIKSGWTATEDWTVTFTDNTWVVEGSRSGPQEFTAEAGTPFIGDRRAVAFTVEGEATEGDFFSFSTDNGLVEFDLGGIPIETRMAPDQHAIAIVVEPEGESGRVRLFDPAAEQFTADVALPAGAEPHRLAWSADGLTLFIADRALPAVHEVDLEGTVTSHALPWPVLDVAPLLTETDDWLYLVPQDSRSVWMYSRESLTLRDINASVSGIQGMDLHSAVLGIEAIPKPFLYPEENDDGVRLFDTAVAVSLQRGGVVFMEPDTGCLLQAGEGPRSISQGSFGSVSDFNAEFDGVSVGPQLAQNPGSDRHIVVNSCAGLARSESWVVTYRENLQAWEVEGTLSGPQRTLAYEDQRYLSDGGEVSFLIQSGTIPTEDGWFFTFDVNEGVSIADGQGDTTNQRDQRQGALGDPVFFYYRVGPYDNGWRVVDERPFVLAPARSNDTVGRVLPQEGRIEVHWE